MSDHCLHLLQIREGLSSFNDASIPLAELLLSAGFFIIYLIEELLQFAKPDYCKHLSHFQVFSEDQDENENVDKMPNPIRTSTPEPNNTEGKAIFTLGWSQHVKRTLNKYGTFAG